MLTLGLSDSHDSGGVVLDDNNIVFAVNEKN